MDPQSSPSIVPKNMVVPAFSIKRIGSNNDTCNNNTNTNSKLCFRGCNAAISVCEKAWRWEHLGSAQGPLGLLHYRGYSCYMSYSLNTLNGVVYGIIYRGLL